MQLCSSLSILWDCVSLGLEWKLTFSSPVAVFPILLFSSISLHWLLRKAFLSLLAILWNSAFKQLTEFCQENALVIANTLFQQHKRILYAWISADGQHWNQIDYILCSQRWRSSIQTAKTRPGADCGSDHELLNAKFRLKLKKIGKATRPFRYDLNKIPRVLEMLFLKNGLLCEKILKTYLPE